MYNNEFKNKFDNFSNTSSYYENMNLDDEFKDLYDSLGKKYKKVYNYNKLRNDNHKIYVSIDINKFDILPEEFEPLVKPIVKCLMDINRENLLTENDYEAYMHNKELRQCLKDLKKLDDAVSYSVNKLITINDRNQKKLDMNQITCKEKDIIENAYKEVILEYANIDLTDIYKEFENQLRRRDKLRNIYSLILKYDSNYINKKNEIDLKEYNNKLKKIIFNYKSKLTYLKDLIMENSSYQNKLISFAYYLNNKLEYDDTDIYDAKRLYKYLTNSNELDNKISSLENLFSKERSDYLKEEKFAYEKTGRKNARVSIDYILNNYLDVLNEEGTDLINYLNRSFDNLDVKDIDNYMEPIVDGIWNKSITNIYEYNYNDNFMFLVVNNIFLDEEVEAILLSNSIINKVTDYSNYEIGFICDYNSNILSITENGEIPNVIINDLSKLKTPKQLEEEFVNFKVCNRIALNGYKTTIAAMYYIDSGNIDVYKRAVTMANTYNLPLIKIKK